MRGFLAGADLERDWLAEFLDLLLLDFEEILTSEILVLDFAAGFLDLFEAAVFLAVTDFDLADDEALGLLAAAFVFGLVSDI